MKREPNAQTDLRDFLEREVYPALWNRLDAAFPEFGFQNKGRYWQATDETTTRGLPGAPRPDRVNAYENTPFGFVVHGGDFMPWVSYVAGGIPPKGRDFIEAVRKLADLAGVSFPEREVTPEEAARFEKWERRGNLLESFLAYTRVCLFDRGKAAYAYLEKRGFTSTQVDALEVGVYSTPADVGAALGSKGFTPEEIEASGVVHDGRWEGRLVGPWRDRSGRIINLWARDLTGKAEDNEKYLMVKGGSKHSPFGLDAARGRDLVLVEGFLDALSLRAAGLPDVVALGGAALGEEQIKALAAARVKSLTLNLDYDPKEKPCESHGEPFCRLCFPGLKGTLQALDKLGRAPFRVYVVDPVRMAENGNLEDKVDPDTYVRRHGLDAYRTLLKEAVRGALFRGDRILREHDLTTDRGKDEAVEALLQYDERLRDERDRQDLWTRAAEGTGYTNESLFSLAQSHAERQERERLERDLRLLLDESRQSLHDEKTTPEDLVRTLADSVETLKSRAHTDEPEPFSVDTLLDNVRNAGEGKRSMWEAVDRLGIRFHPAELAVLGARTGHGKTTAMLSLLLNWLEAYPDEGFLFYSYELPPEAVFLKLASALTRKQGGEGWTYYEIKDYLQGKDRPDNYPNPKELEKALKTLRSWEDRLLPVYRPSWSVEDLVAHARKVDDRTGAVGAVLVDYLQIVPPPPGSFDRRDMEVSTVARRLKKLSVDLSCPVVTAAQINREAIQRQEKLPAGKPFEDKAVQDAIKKRRPQLHNLREGGSEQEADLVLGLLNYRADYIAELEEHGEEAGAREKGKPGRFDVVALKNRYGELGAAALVLEGRTGTIRDPEPGEGV